MILPHIIIAAKIGLSQDKGNRDRSAVPLEDFGHARHIVPDLIQGQDFLFSIISQTFHSPVLFGASLQLLQFSRISAIPDIIHILKILCISVEKLIVYAILVIELSGKIHKCQSQDFKRSTRLPVRDRDTERDSWDIVRCLGSSDRQSRLVSFQIELFKIDILLVFSAALPGDSFITSAPHKSVGAGCQGRGLGNPGASEHAQADLPVSSGPERKAAAALGADSFPQNGSFIQSRPNEIKPDIAVAFFFQNQRKAHAIENLRISGQPLV